MYTQMPAETRRAACTLANDGIGDGDGNVPIEYAMAYDGVDMHAGGVQFTANTPTNTRHVTLSSESTIAQPMLDKSSARGTAATDVFWGGAGNGFVAAQPA